MFFTPVFFTSYVSFSLVFWKQTLFLVSFDAIFWHWHFRRLFRCRQFPVSLGLLMVVECYPQFSVTAFGCPEGDKQDCCTHRKILFLESIKEHRSHPYVLWSYSWYWLLQNWGMLIEEVDIPSRPTDFCLPVSNVSANIYITPQLILPVSLNGLQKRYSENKIANILYL